MQLEDEQYELLGRFVEAHLSTPRESRGTFNANWYHNDQQATFSHSRDQSLRFQGNWSDAEILARVGLLLESAGSSGSVTFSVLPEGIDVHQKRKASLTPPHVVSVEPHTGQMSKVKILFLAANPVVTSQLQLDREAREIEEKLRGTKERDKLELVTKWALRPDDLQQYLLEHQPHVVHFSGHGSQTNELILEDKDGKPKALVIMPCSPCSRPCRITFVSWC